MCVIRFADKRCVKQLAPSHLHPRWEKAKTFALKIELPAEVFIFELYYKRCPKSINVLPVSYKYGSLFLPLGTKRKENIMNLLLPILLHLAIASDLFSVTQGSSMLWLHAVQPNLTGGTRVLAFSSVTTLNCAA